MRRWRTDLGLTARSPVAALDGLETHDVDWLTARIFRYLVNPSRRLPTGVTLADLAGGDLGEFTEHVDGTLGGFAATAERCWARFALYRMAAHGGSACPHWWGTPTWPELVRTFVHTLDDPSHSHWGPGRELEDSASHEPAQVVDLVGLQRVLLNRPWDLGADAARWIVNAGIGHLRTRAAPLPALPDDLVFPVDGAAD
jgi:hypothetical protein